FLRDGAGGEVAELMAADALAALERADPFDLGDIGRDVTLTAELVGARDLHHCVPVDRRIIHRRGGLTRRRHRRKIEMLTGLAVDLGGIDEAIAAHPDLVLGLGGGRGGAPRAPGPAGPPGRSPLAREGASRAPPPPPAGGPLGGGTAPAYFVSVGATRLSHALRKDGKWHRKKGRNRHGRSAAQ